MKLISHWLGEGICLAMAVAAGLFALQAPALTHDYAEGLLQVAGQIEQDAANRVAAARRFYDLGDAADAQVLAALAAREPSNAATLSAAITELQALQAAHARIEAAPDLLQPLVMGIDLAENGSATKARILRTSLGSFVPGLPFTPAAVVYGLVGLFAGRLLGGLLTAPLRRRQPAM